MVKDQVQVKLATESLRKIYDKIEMFQENKERHMHTIEICYKLVSGSDTVPEVKNSSFSGVAFQLINSLYDGLYKGTELNKTFYKELKKHSFHRNDMYEDIRELSEWMKNNG